jgi:uncharacterized Tic20 family protein
MDNRNLGIKIKDLRNRKGLSQELLSEETQLSLRTIQRIEKGESIPRGDTLIRLTQALGVTPDDLLDWTKIEDKGFLTLLNLSALTGVLIHPILGIIIPLVMWILKKDKVNMVDDTGKKLINFQISWTVLVYLIFIIASKGTYINYSFDIGELLRGILNLNYRDGELQYLVIFAIIYLYNFLLIVINTIRNRKGFECKYVPAIPILR